MDIKFLHPPEDLAQSQTASVVREKLIYWKVTVKINESSNKNDPAAAVICFFALHNATVRGSEHGDA